MNLVVGCVCCGRVRVRVRVQVRVQVRGAILCWGVAVAWLFELMVVVAVCVRWGGGGGGQ